MLVSKVLRANFIVLVSLLIEPCLLAQEEFSAPLPPPELGDTLTSYKTKQQLLHAAALTNHPPTTPTPHTPTKTEIRVAQQPTTKEIVQLKDVFYISGNGLKFDVADRSLLHISVTDGMDVSWPIAKVVVSNSNFIAQLDDTSQNITIKSNANGNQLAKLKIYLQGDEQPLEFVLGKTDDSPGVDYARRIKITAKSPLNDGQRDTGITNMIVTSKSRNSRRDVEVKAEVVNEPKVADMDFGKVRVVNKSISLEQLNAVANVLQEAIIANENK